MEVEPCFGLFFAGLRRLLVAMGTFNHDRPSFRTVSMQEDAVLDRMDAITRMSGALDTRNGLHNLSKLCGGLTSFVDYFGTCPSPSEGKTAEVYAFLTTIFQSLTVVLEELQSFPEELRKQLDEVRADRNTRLQEAAQSSQSLEQQLFLQGTSYDLKMIQKDAESAERMDQLINQDLEIDSLRQLIVNIESKHDLELHETDQIIGDLQNRLEVADDFIAQNLDHLTGMSTNLETLHQEVLHLDEHVAEQKLKIHDSEVASSILERSVGLMREHLDGKASDLESLQYEFDQSASRAERAECKANSLEGRIDVLKGELEVYQAKVDHLSPRVEQLSTELNETRKDRDKCKEEREQAKELRKQCQLELDEKRRQERSSKLVTPKSPSLPEFNLIGASHIRAGKTVVKALPPAADAPTGPKGGAPRDAPKGPRATSRGPGQNDGFNAGTSNRKLNDMDKASFAPSFDSFSSPTEHSNGYAAKGRTRLKRTVSSTTGGSTTLDIMQGLSSPPPVATTSPSGAQAFVQPNGFVLKSFFTTEADMESRIPARTGPRNYHGGFCGGRGGKEFGGKLN